MTRPIRRAPAVRTLSALLLLASPLFAAEGDFLGRGFDAFDLGGADTDSGTAVVVQPDGKVIVAGTVLTGASTYTLALARFLPDGSLDPTFGTGGEAVNPFNEANNLRGVALHLLPDGRFLVACTFDFGTADQDFWVGRLLEGGTRDNSFGGGGFGARLVPFDLGGDLTDTLSAMTVDRNGRILLAGSVDISATDIDFGVVRLTSEGLLDSDFSQDGKTTVAISTLDFGLAIAYDTTGIVVGGASWNADLGGHFDLALIRLQGNGDIDGNFGAARLGHRALGPGRHQQRLRLGARHLARRRDRRRRRRRDRNRPVDVPALQLLGERHPARQRRQHLLRLALLAPLFRDGAGLAARPPPPGRRQAPGRRLRPGSGGDADFGRRALDAGPLSRPRLRRRRRGDDLRLRRLRRPHRHRQRDGVRPRRPDRASPARPSGAASTPTSPGRASTAPTSSPTASTGRAAPRAGRRRCPDGRRRHAAARGLAPRARRG